MSCSPGTALESLIYIPSCNMKLLSALIAFASATFAFAAVLPIEAAAKATAAVLVHREPVRATAALEERRVPSPGSYVANARDLKFLPKVDEVVAKAAAAVTARDVLKDEVLAIVKADAAIIAREPQPFEKFVPPVIAVKVDEPIKAEGVVIARDVLHEIPKIDALAKAAAVVF